MHKFTTHLPLLTKTIKRFFKYEASESAEALTFTTLFAIVPLLTITYAILSRLSISEDVSNKITFFILEHFVTSTGSEAISYLQSFSREANNLAWPGFVMLAFTSFLLLRQIESCFNKIWQTKEARRGWHSLLIYWGYIGLAPLLIAAGIFINSYVLSVKVLDDAVNIAALEGVLFTILPLVLNVLALSVLYIQIPNCKVPVFLGVFGALCAALLIEIVRQGFTLFFNYISPYSLIYGAFAVIPFILLWLYMGWVVILLGVTWVAVLTEDRAEHKTHLKRFRRH